VSGAALLELEWLGGSVGARMRKRRPGIDDLPWGTLARAVESGAFSAHGILEARATWTNGVFTEYASAAAFAAMSGAFLECGAPIDLSAAAADIVVDEIDHAEVGSRLVMELGGAVPLRTDLAMVSPATTPGVSPVVRAAEIAIKTSCVGEAMSVSALSRAADSTDHPLVRAALDRLLGDEGPHARIGTQFLDWADDRLTDGDRAHLAQVALDSIAVYRPLWVGRCSTCEAPADLGGMPVQSHADLLVEAIRTRVVRQLEHRRIMLDRDQLDAILS
jgi:hypothetical protein